MKEKNEKNKNKKKIKKIIWLSVAAVLVVAIAVAIITTLPGKVKYSSAAGESVNILFTHDVHDHYEAHTVSGASQPLGGYGRLATAIKENRKSNSVVVDAGDFSMGSVIQTVFEYEAPSLRILGAMGYDAVTLGNHEFDYGSGGLANALNSAAEIGGNLPSLLVANLPDVTENTGTVLSSALHNYGAEKYKIINRGGVKIGMFGVVAKSAMSSAYRSTTDFSDEKKAAKDAVSALKAEGAVIIICLSHGGTSDISAFSADENLARSVSGIDVIISGHSHTVLETPKCAGGTLIVSCGQNGEKLGSLSVVRDGDGWAVKNYKLIDIDNSFTDDKSIVSMTDSILDDVDKKYMSHFGYKLNDVLAQTSFSFVTDLEYGNNHYNEPLGQFICDAQKYAVKQAESGKKDDVDVALVMDASIRGSIEKGDVTVGDLYAVRGIGYGNDGYSGDPVVSFYLNGKELKRLCEIDASLSDFSPAIQLYMSGINYTYSPKALFLHKVKDVYLSAGEKKTAVSEKKLYRISTCLYNMDTFKMISSYSVGLLSIVPKNSDGSVIKNYNSAVVYTTIGSEKRELKEWYALTQYAASFPKDKSDVPQISEHYNNLFSERTILPKTDIWGYVIVVLTICVIIAAIVVPVKISKHRKKK